MKKIYNYSTILFFIFSLFFVVNLKAQVSISSNVSPLINSVSSNTISVTINYNNNSCTASTSTVTLAFPSGVSYIQGSVIKTNGTAGLNIGYVSGPNTAPQFTITGGGNGSTITFSVLREANCAAVSTNDTIYVATPCISTSVGTTLPNTNKSISLNYNVSSPYLFINTQTPIINAAIGSSYTRTLSIGNSGVSCIDTLHFFTIQNATSLQLINLKIGSTTLIPVRVQGDTTFYDITDLLLPTGGTLCNNGQSVIFTETVKVLNCVDLNTKYGAAWGNGISSQKSSYGGWCAVTQTPQIPITITNDVSNFTGYNYVGSNFVNMCTAFTYTTTYTTTGSGAMYNTHIKAGLAAMWWGSTGMDLGSYDIQNVYLQNNLGVLVPAVFTFDASNDVDVNMTQFNFDPDGNGIGFNDLNGDGIYNDLPAGNTFTLVIKKQYKCNATCNSNNYIQSSAPNGNLTWDDMCGNAVIGQHLTSGPYYYGSSGNIIPDLNVSLPPNVIGGVNFDLQICPSAVNNWNYPPSAAGHYWEWKLVLPPGVSLNTAGYGPAATFTASGDTITVRGNSGAMGLDCLKANLIYNCGVTDTLKFSYSLSYINDINSNCRCRGIYICGSKIFTMVKCPSNCAIGLSPNNPKSGRTNGSFGYTDNTLTTHVSPSSLSLLERQLALYLDTIFIKGSAIQLGNANNGYIEFKISKAGANHVLFPELTTSTFKHYRSGTLLNSVNGLVPANLINLSNATTSIFRYDFTSNLSGGQLLNNDSIVVDLRYIVSTNNLPGSPIIPSGISWQSFNIINSNKVTCDSLGWAPIIYPISSGSRVSNWSSSFTNANCGGVSSFNFVNQRSVQMSFFENEYRPEKYNDSVTVFIPNGYVFSSFTVGSLDLSYSAACLPPQNYLPSHVSTVLGGKLYTFINDGSWVVAPIHSLYQYGLGSFKVDVKATCSSPEVANLVSNVYFKDYYYTYSQPRGTLLPPSSGAAFANSGSVNFTVNYPNVTRPAVSLTNQTGTVIFAKPIETFNLRVNSIGFNTATNVWVATDGNPNINIIQMVDPVTSTTIIPTAYSTGTVTGSLFNLTAAGIPSGNFKDYTVYFTYNSCINDSIKLYSGWNCDNFPLGGNPLTDITSCPTRPIYIKLNPQSSKFQLSVTQNPKSPGINLCTSDTVIVVMNSIDAANIVNPSMTFTVLPGISISGVLVEYPLNSGQWQTIPYTNTTTPVNTYFAAIGSHTNIGSQGLLGTYYGNTPELRQVKVKIAYSADCNYLIGSYIGIIGKGYRVCDQTIQANSDYNGFIKTSNINVNGASANGATAAVDMSMIPPTLSCSSTVLPLNIIPYFQPTGTGDLATYILPDNINYVPGSFLSGIPTATLGSVNTAAGTTTLIIKLPAGVPVNTPITYSINVTSCGVCKSNKIKCTVTKNFSGFTCNNIVCSNIPTVLGSDSIVVNTINNIVNIIRDTVCQGSISSITTHTGSSTTTHTFSAAGDYTVSLQTAANGCDSTVVFAVRLSPNPTAPIIRDTSLCEGKYIVITPLVPNGQVYLWYDQPVNGNLLANNSYTTPNLSAGTYTYYIESQENVTHFLCKSLTRNELIVTVFSNPASINVNSATICIGQQTATLTASGALTYSWTPAADLNSTSGNIVLGTPLTTKSFTVTGTDVHGCSNTATTTIYVKPLPIVTASSSTICIGQQTATLTAGGAQTYIWNTSATTQTISESPITTSTYTIIGKDTNGCINTATTTILVNTLPTVTVTSSTICLGQQTATLTASGASTYSWTAGLSALSGYSVTGTPTITGTYTVTGTDGNGCKGINYSTISVNSLPIVTTTSSTICIGQQTATLTASGAQSYTWNTGSIGQTITDSPIVNTTYTVIGTDANSCTNTATATILVNGLPPIVASSSTICLGQQTATLTASGGTTYTWSAGLNPISNQSATGTPTITTTYSITGTDINGCKNNATTIINVNTLPVITATGNTICIGSNGVISASGALNYTWSPTANLNSTIGTSVTANPTLTTLYNVSGTDVNGCVNTNTASVIVNSLPTIITSPSFSMCSGNTGTLTANGANTYTWTPTLNLSSANGSIVTSTTNVTETYTVTGTDLNTCINNSVTKITVVKTPTLAITSTSNIVCPTFNSTLTASGATNYTWSPSNTLSSATGSIVIAAPVSTQTYIVTGANSNCTSNAQIVITVTVNPIITVNSQTICSTQSATINANGGISYTWSPGNNLNTTTSGTVISTPQTTQVYTVFGSSPLGCIGISNSTITVIQTPTLVTSSSSTMICAGNNTTLTANGATSYTWLPSSINNTNGNTINVSPRASTIYTVSGTNGASIFGCADTKTIEIIVTPIPVIVTGGNATICEGQSTIIYATGSTRYTWSPTTGVNHIHDSTISVTPIGTGIVIYTVTGTKNNCSNTATVQITINGLPILNAGIDTTINIDNTITLHGTGNTTIGFIYASTGVPLNCNYCPNVTVNPQENTCYTLQGISNEGCVNTDIVCINVTKDWDVFIPNAFTPNGDTYNEIFIPMGYGIAEINLIIFDRWGAQIFKSNGENIGWDGKNKGQLCKQDVYIYKAEIKAMSGETVFKTGHVTLLSKVK